ncbi:uncharacterized protein LOC130902492 [Diorhabda carinulata]|uniref:uncharacterized protein LOC130902492 n=1 Tax=Diorhabda carinulata TaxID=1163345 RepID=UPI0025A0F6BE|nr:uncharacterized protein LOC130902492 [Diorhabda carinulata]
MKFERLNTSTGNYIVKFQGICLKVRQKMDEATKQKCERTVLRNKYERNSRDMYEWWIQLFNMLESDFAIQEDVRYSTLKEILPVDLFYRLLEIISVKKEQFQLPDDNVDEETEEVIFPKKHSTEESLIDSEERKKSATISEFRKNLGIILEKKSPYMEFFKRKPNRAAIWKELPPLKWEEMDLGQMAEAITEAIATDYVEWLKTMGGSEETTLNVQSIKEMFEIGSQTNTSTAVFVELKEIASVNQKTADALGLPHKSRMNVLQEQIEQDRIASRKKQRLCAFGKRLPVYMQVKPPPKDLYKKWLQCEYIPPKLESMATVWQGITNLRSTRVFCEFLYRHHPAIKPPKYLIEKGLMDPKNFGKQLEGTEESESIEEFEEDMSNRRSTDARKSLLKKSGRVDARKSLVKK